MDVVSTADAVERLKRHDSLLTTCQVFDAAGTMTPVGVPKLRTKWARFARTFDELGWTQIRAIGKNGELLEIFDLLVAQPPEEQLEELPEELDVSYRFAERVCQLVLNGQKAALASYVEQHKVTMEGQSKLIGVLTDRLMSLEKMFGKTLKLAHDSALVGEDGEEMHSGEAIVGMLGQMLFAQKAKEAAAGAAAGAAASSQTASPPKNGTPEGK